MRFIIIIFCCCLVISCKQAQSSQSPTDKIEQQVASKSKENLSIVMGKFDPKRHPSFTLVDKQYADREGLYLHRETYEAFKKMHVAAKSENIELVIRSATRNFDYQKGIWERKWTGTTKIENDKNAALAYPAYNKRAQKILEYSSMPGTSRHHWGTDIDLNNFENDYFESGQGLKEYDWLTANASSFGFCQVYTKKGALRPNGYNEEKWHWSYLPVAKKLIQIAKDSLSNQMIGGFAGSEVATELSVVEKYVFGINPECL